MLIALGVNFFKNRSSLILVLYEKVQSQNITSSSCYRSAAPTGCFSLLQREPQISFGFVAYLSVLNQEIAVLLAPY